MDNNKIIVDGSDKHLLHKYKWFINRYGYARSSFQKKRKNTNFYLHRMIMNAPNEFDIDHINGNKIDNRRCNLRICKEHQNSWNRNKRTTKGLTSKFIGVCFVGDKTRKKRWVASLKSNIVNVNIRRSFSTELEAAMFYDLLAKKYYGDFSKTNFKENLRLARRGR